MPWSSGTTPGGEFAAQVDAIGIEGVQVLRLDRTPALQAKISIEREVGGRWLIYAPFDEPEPAFRTGCWTRGCAASPSAPIRRRSSWRNWA
jgi:hypothetical protein